jgi:histidine triad (HIT) family protein
MSDCLFCQIIAGTIPSNKVLDTDDFFGFRDVNPQAPQHILIIPKRHIERHAELQESDALLIGRMMVQASLLAHELGMDEQGYRLVINNGAQAGQSVWHLHLHILSGRPFRWPPG